MQVIHNLSLHIKANQHTGIVGLSGSGKSTLASLIGRLYDPTSGDVFIDGHNLRDINVKSLRRHIGTVAQSSSLFDKSVLENIAHGLVNSPSPAHAALQKALLDDSLPVFVELIRQGISVEDALASSSSEVQQIYALAVAAAQDSNALTFIQDFHHGFATAVGATGGQLSGGQKQRVVLARALIRQPSILILDEATAALDSHSERVVQDALERITDSSRTTITIAHRLSTIKKADHIVVMRDGVIIEEGPHAELLAKEDGAFAAMVKLQNAGSPTDDSPSTSRSGSLSSIEKVKGYGLSKETLVNEITDDAPEEKKKPAEEKPNISNLTGVLIMARPYAGFICLGIVASVIVGGSYSAEAVIFGHTVGELSACKTPESIREKGAFFGLMFFVLACIEFFANSISTSSFGRVAEKMLVRLRILVLRFLFRQDIEWHESDGRTPSSLLAYISSDTNSMAGLTGTILGVVLAIIINMVAGIVLAHIIAWKIAVVLLSMIPILLVSGFLRLKIAANFHTRHATAFADSVGLATEAVGSMRTIASYSLEEETLACYERSLKGPYDATIKAIVKGNFFLAVAYSIGNLVYAMAYWWGSKQIVAGLYSPQQFFTTLPALLFSAQSCGQLLSLAPDVSKATVAAGRVLALLQSIPSNTNSAEESNFHKHAKTPDLGEKGSDSDAEGGLATQNEKISAAYANSTKGASVLFRDVHFAYPSRPSRPVLEGLTLAIPSNSFTAIVGPSGAGKSTVISLLERFYNPSQGTVMIDGIDVRHAPVSFRDIVALVPQESTLFEGTLRFNLELGARPGSIPTQAELVEACRLANIHETIMALPQGYDTLCGPRGTAFSGGQIQRLAIARALVRRPRLLLLDESTSALDAESEAALQEALEGATRGVTVVAVAHRMRTVRNADCIILVEGGKVADGGRHEELLERSEAYREMVALQTLG